MSIKGLIFDFDGLILDTETAALESWREVYVEHGCELTTDIWAKVLGGSGAEWNHVAHLEAVTGRSLDERAIRQRRFARKQAMIEAEAALPGVLELMGEAKDAGLSMAIVSSSAHAWVDTYVDKLGLGGLMKTVLCGDDVAHVKPAPDLYLLALEKLGSQSDDVIAFEDSPNGVRAAQAAGIRCVAVLNPVSRLLDMEHADLILESMAETSLEGLKAWIAVPPGSAVSRP